jgi:hypothetical protein
MTMVADHIIERLYGLDITPLKKSTKTAIFIIDEMGPFGCIARAICRMTLAGVDARICDALLVPHIAFILVGTGIDSALANTGSMASSFEHVCLSTADELRGMYERASVLWKMIVNLPQGATLTHSGIVSKLRRLSWSPRMAALLMKFERRQVDGGASQKALPDVRKLSPGAERSAVLAFAMAAVWDALSAVKSYNGLCKHDSLSASFEFGVALAVACSDVHQKLPPDSSDVLVRFGLIRDSAELRPTSSDTLHTVLEALDEVAVCIPTTAAHRYRMEAPAVETGLHGFGARMPRSGWDGFEAMFCDYLELLVIAACALPPATSACRACPMTVLTRWRRSSAPRPCRGYARHGRCGERASRAHTSEKTGDHVGCRRPEPGGGSKGGVQERSCRRKTRGVELVRCRCAQCSVGPLRRRDCGHRYSQRRVCLCCNGHDAGAAQAPGVGRPPYRL